MLEKYGYRVLDHRFNIRHGCPACNSYAMLLLSELGGEELLVLDILTELKERERTGRPSIKYLF